MLFSDVFKKNPGYNHLNRMLIMVTIAFHETLSNQRLTNKQTTMYLYLKERCFLTYLGTPAAPLRHWVWPKKL